MSDIDAALPGEMSHADWCCSKGCAGPGFCAGCDNKCTCPAEEFNQLRTRASAAEAEVRRLHSWQGVMSLLDEHYPAHIFTGTSGDPGPRILTLIREIDRIRSESGSQ